MADKKITELTNITGANLADADEFVVVDSSASETKAITRSELGLGINKLGYNGTQKIITTSTGVDVTGTITADGLVTDTTNGVKINTSSVVEASWTHADVTGTSTINVGRNSTWGGNLIIQTDIKNRANFASNGDISFYEDTGTTPKFFWDASAEALGIGTSSPAKKLHIDGASAGTITQALLQNSSGGNVELRLAPTAYPNDIGSTARWSAIQAINGGAGNPTSLAFLTNAVSSDPAERLRITSSGNVGIGTSSPDAALRVSSGSDLQARFSSVDGRGLAIRTFTSAGTSNNGVIYDAGIFSDAQHVWRCGGTERMRIDSSGRVGIGTSTINNPFSVATAVQIGSTSAAGSLLTLAGSGRGTIYFADAADAYAGYIDYQHVDNSLRIGTATSERLRIDSSGNVGIGTSSPSYKLEVDSVSVQNVANFIGTAGAYVRLTNDTGQADIGSTGNNLLLRTNSSERMRIDSNGRVGIGTTSMTYPLDVRDAAGATINVQTASGNAAVRIASTASGSPRLDLVSSPGTQSIYGGVGSVNNMVFYVNATERMRIDSSGNLLVGTTTALEKFTCGGRASFAGYIYPTTDNAYSCGLNGNRWSAIWAANGTIQTSDQRDKTEIVESPLGLDFVLALEPVAYKFKVGKNLVGEDGQVTPVAGTRQHFGLIAQQVKEVCGEVDFGGWIKTDPEDSESAEGLRYDQFIAPLIKAVQEQQAQIEDLKARVAALEA